jgi:hypothetical protein
MSCGYFGDPSHSCSCGTLAIERYRSRISGPPLDRIDIHLEVPSVAYGDLIGEHFEETSVAIRARVEQARAVQRTRFQGQRGVHANAHMTARDLRRQPPATYGLLVCMMPRFRVALSQPVIYLATLALLAAGWAPGIWALARYHALRCRVRMSVRSRRDTSRPQRRAGA